MLAEWDLRVILKTHFKNCYKNGKIICDDCFQHFAIKHSLEIAVGKFIPIS